MKAGRLRHRIDIQRKEVTLDSDGAQEVVWVNSFSTMISAEIMPLSGRELIAADAVQSKVNTRIRIRYRPGIVASMRVVHRGTYYNIEAIIPDPDSGESYLTLNCTSGDDEG
jgi:SPP1 family predicted phage head-tail adaptor